MKISKAHLRQRSLLAGAATLALAAGAVATPAHAIVPNDNITPEEAVDTDDEFSGVGMFFRNDGFVCTGSLINPRTVLFAAHCVNDRPESDYAVDGTIRSAFSFNVNALPGFLAWINNNFTSFADQAVFNVNQIVYDPRSLADPAAAGFLEADIALASLDTPAANLPTWSLLFSPLPSPDSIDPVTGTGYHVNITGYGRSGSGTTGSSQGIDWRRRAAENMLGSLTSFNERNTFLFGNAFGDLPQSLYRLDFDDPNKTNPFDFNLYKDEPLAGEGTTAGGDSGGPLILDAANNSLSDEDLVIGVLSGGSRFFGAQVFSSYGTESFYQPLYLYWDYIVANNPYRYVTAKAGDGNWEDGSHWETTLDPVYRIIDDTGAVVNGLPTTLGAGTEGGSPDFGEVCFDPEGDNPGDGCQDLETGDLTPPARPGPDGGEGGETGIDAGIGNNLGVVDPSELQDLALNGAGLTLDGVENIAISTDLSALELEDIAISTGVEFAEESPSDGAEIVEDEAQGPSGGAPEFTDTANPDPTLANGLPGATDFVPDNIDPDGTVGPRYYDVTLANAGTTTLSSEATIDRLTVQSTAGLTIAGDDGEGGEGGNLNVLIDVSQFGGTVTVDGQLTSVGDYTLFGGALQGSGTITTPFLTNFMGAISPGTIGGIDTLTIDGNVVMTAASNLLIDIDDAGNSDTLNVTGDAIIRGVVGVGGGIANQVNGLGQTYTIVTADGSINGTFVRGQIGAILSQSFTYEENAVLMQINAASYSTAIDPASTTQTAYAQLFDQNRGNAALAGLFGLDFENRVTIRDTFEGLNPVSETTVRTLTAQSYTHMQNFTSNRMRETDRRSNGGSIATLGSPIQTAAVSSRGVQPLNGAALAFDDHGEETGVQNGAVSEDVAIYLAGGFINGRGQSLLGSDPNTPFDGHFYAAGFEYFPDNNTVIGISGYHSELEADAPLGQAVESSIWGASLYASHETEGGVVIDGMFSFANLEVETERTVAFLGGSQTLSTDSNDDGIAAAAGIGYKVESGDESLTPGVEVRYARNSFDTIDETGGILALRINRETYTSFQGRAGADYQLTKPNFKLNIGADVVYEFEDSPTLFQAQFAAGTGPTAGFGLGSTDDTWGEVSVSGTVGEGPFTLGLGVDATIGRTSANAQVWRATAAYTF